MSAKYGMVHSFTGVTLTGKYVRVWLELGFDATEEIADVARLVGWPLLYYWGERLRQSRCAWYRRDVQFDLCSTLLEAYSKEWQRRGPIIPPGVRQPPTSVKVSYLK